MDIEKRTVF